MDIGVFIPIGNNGWLISETAPQYMPSFELNKEITLKAEKYGFDFALSMIKLRGFGGKTEFWEHNLESFTLMAGLAAVTSKIKIFAHRRDADHAAGHRRAHGVDHRLHRRRPLRHQPDHRLAEAEYDQMGLWPGESHYKDRYNYLAEYATVLKELMETGVATSRASTSRWTTAGSARSRRRREDHLRRLQRRGPGLHRSVCGLHLRARQVGPTRRPPSRRSTPPAGGGRARPAATWAPTSCS